MKAPLSESRTQPSLRDIGGLPVAYLGLLWMLARLREWTSPPSWSGGT
jgi:hypothetical protein